MEDLDKELDLKTIEEIKKKASALKEAKKLRKVFPIAVFGDKEAGEKDVYVAYFKEPDYPAFSKFIAASKRDEVAALRQIAKDCFVDGDKELVDNDSLFLMGCMAQLQNIMSVRQSVLVNL